MPLQLVIHKKYFMMFWVGESNDSTSYVSELKYTNNACNNGANAASICKLLAEYICLAENSGKSCVTSEANECTNCQHLRRVCVTSSNYCYGSSMYKTYKRKVKI